MLEDPFIDIYMVNLLVGNPQTLLLNITQFKL